MLLYIGKYLRYLFSFDFIEVMLGKREKLSQGGGGGAGANASKEFEEGVAEISHSKRQRYPFCFFLFLIFHYFWCFFSKTAKANLRNPASLKFKQRKFLPRSE